MNMKRLKLYIETSVWNFLFATDAVDKMLETKRFFQEINPHEYELFISELVIEEISNAPEPLRSGLFGAIADHEPEKLEVTSEIRDLAAKYAASGLVPPKAYNDLVHLAAATVNNMDFLVSWNLAHIVRIKTKIGINAVNAVEGYREMNICTVAEVP